MHEENPIDIMHAIVTQNLLMTLNDVTIGDKLRRRVLQLIEFLIYVVKFIITFVNFVITGFIS